MLRSSCVLGGLALILAPQGITLVSWEGPTSQTKKESALSLGLFLNVIPVVSKSSACSNILYSLIFPLEDQTCFHLDSSVPAAWYPRSPVEHLSFHSTLFSLSQLASSLPCSWPLLKWLLSYTHVPPSLSSLEHVLTFCNYIYIYISYK